MFTKLKLQELIAPGDEVRIWTVTNKIMDGIVVDIGEEVLTLHREAEGKTFEMYIDIDEIEVPQKVIKLDIPKGVNENQKED